MFYQWSGYPMPNDAWPTSILPFLPHPRGIQRHKNGASKQPAWQLVHASTQLLFWIETSVIPRNQDQKTPIISTTFPSLSPRNPSKSPCLQKPKGSKYPKGSVMPMTSSEGSNLGVSPRRSTGSTDGSTDRRRADDGSTWKLQGTAFPPPPLKDPSHSLHR